jgi:hypothetical protein
MGKPITVSPFGQIIKGSHALLKIFAEPLGKVFARLFQKGTWRCGKNASRHPFWKVLVKLFQKLAQVKGAKPFSPSAEGETPLTAFLFCELFSLRQRCQRKKWGNGF